LSPSETLEGDEYWELLEGSGLVGECTDGWWETKTPSMSSRASPIRVWRVLRLARVAMGGFTGREEERTQAGRGKHRDAFYIHDLHAREPMKGNARGVYGLEYAAQNGQYGSCHLDRPLSRA
jgi:hypothetical protein